MFGINIDDIKGATTEEAYEMYDGHRQVVNFANGYSASVVNHRYSRGLELAVMHDGEIVYDTPITDDVLNYLTEAELNQALRGIAGLRRRPEPTHITYWYALSIARKVVEEFGDGHRADGDGCTYVTCEAGKGEDGNIVVGPLRPVCLVGQILARMGVSLELMEGFSSLNNERDNFKNNQVTFTDRAYHFLDTLQAVQDMGETWGLALSIASTTTRRRKWTERSEKLLSV